MSEFSGDDAGLEKFVPGVSSTAIGIGAEASAPNMLALAAGGRNVLELYGDTGEIRVFGKTVTTDKELAEGVHEALRAFMAYLRAREGTADA